MQLESHRERHGAAPALRRWIRRRTALAPHGGYSAGLRGTLAEESVDPSNAYGHAGGFARPTGYVVIRGYGYGYGAAVGWHPPVRAADIGHGGMGRDARITD